MYISPMRLYLIPEDGPITFKNDHARECEIHLAYTDPSNPNKVSYLGTDSGEIITWKSLDCSYDAHNEDVENFLRLVQTELIWKNSIGKKKAPQSKSKEYLEWEAKNKKANPVIGTSDIEVGKMYIEEPDEILGVTQETIGYIEEGSFDGVGTLSDDDKLARIDKILKSPMSPKIP